MLDYFLSELVSGIIHSFRTERHRAPILRVFQVVVHVAIDHKIVFIREVYFRDKQYNSDFLQERFAFLICVGNGYFDTKMTRIITSYFAYGLEIDS